MKPHSPPASLGAFLCPLPVFKAAVIVYKIWCRPTGLSYVGKFSRDSLAEAWNLHVKNAAKQKAKGHPRSAEYISLHDAINDHGVGAFTIQFIEQGITDKNVLLEREAFWVKELGTLWPHGYNITPGGKSHNMEVPVVRRRIQQSLAMPDARERLKANGLKGAAIGGLEPLSWATFSELAQRQRPVVRRLDANHKRWHVKRGIINPRCSLCCPAPTA